MKDKNNDNENLKSESNDRRKAIFEVWSMVRDDWQLHCRLKCLDCNDRELFQAYVGGYIDCHFRNIKAQSEITKALNQELRIMEAEKKTEKEF